MAEGISPNKLNDISKVYLDMVTDINKKEQDADVKRWQKEDAQYGYDKKGQSLNPKDIKKRKLKVKEASCEGFSNWRKDLREVTSDAEATDIDNQPEIKEKKVKNKIKINPEFKEAVKQMGGELLEVTEVDDKKKDPKADADAYKDKQMSDKEKKLKLRILRVKMMAAKQGADSSIVAHYEPDIEGAVEYFFEEGINEEGIDQLVEEIGLDEFVNFIEGGTIELNEARDARRATVRAKKYDVVKKEVDKADAARKKSGKGEYAPSYAKKETDVTVYDDDKPAAKKKAVVKKAAPAKKPAPAKKVAPAKKPAAPKKPVTKKVVKAVAKVKKTQPAKKASKPGIRQKIATLYKRGVERHKKARAAGRVPEKRAKEFGKGVASGVKTAVKFAKDVKKVVSKEELEMQEKVLDKFEKGEKERIVKGMKKSSKDLKKRYGDKWKNVMYATATKKAKEAGDTSKSDKRYAYEETQIDELNRYEKETGKSSGGVPGPNRSDINTPRKGTPTKKGGLGKNDPVSTVKRNTIRPLTGRPEGQKKRDYDARHREQDRREKPARTMERIRQMRRDAEKLMRDTSGT